MKKLAEITNEVNETDIFKVNNDNEEIKVKFVSDYFLKGVLGLALVSDKVVLVSRKLKNFPNFLRKVISHELEHLRDPSASELEIRRRTGTLFPSYSIY